MRRKDHVRLLSPGELRDIRAREEREGTPYSDRDMLLDHIELLRADEGFAERLRASVERNQQILDRLAE